jgi:hypothetical protein
MTPENHKIAYCHSVTRQIRENAGMPLYPASPLSVHSWFVQNYQYYSTHYLYDKFQDFIKRNLLKEISESFHMKMNSILQAAQQKEYVTNQWVLICRLAALKKLMEDLLNSTIVTEILPVPTRESASYYESKIQKRREVITAIDRLISSAKASDQDSDASRPSHSKHASIPQAPVLPPDDQKNMPTNSKDD